MRSGKLLWMLPLTLLIACAGGEREEAASTGTAAAADPAEPASQSAEASFDPCSVLDDALVREHFGDVQVKISKSDNPGRHPICTARWPKPNAEELEKERARKMSEYMTAKMQGKDVSMPSFRTENEVYLTVQKKPFEDEATAASAFESSMRVLEQGLGKRGDREAITQFRTKTEPVHGVARQARWAPKMNQLSVLSGRQIFHVGVKVGEKEENLEKAKELAREIAGKVR